MTLKLPNAAGTVVKKRTTEQNDHFNAAVVASTNAQQETPFLPGNRNKRGKAFPKIYKSGVSYDDKEND